MWKHTWIVEVVLQQLADHTGLVILDPERSFILEVDFSTEGYKGVHLQYDEAGWLWLKSYSSKLKGDKCYWTTLKGVSYTICYCLCKFAHLLQFYLGFEIKIVVPEVATAIALDNFGAQPPFVVLELCFYNPIVKQVSSLKVL